MTRKKAESLSVVDLAAHPVWMFVGSDEHGETIVRPIRRGPVKGLQGKLFGTQVRLVNGLTTWALIGNLAQHPRKAEQFLSISVEHDGRSFHLARYFDPDYSSRDPAALAAFLGLHVDQVFPIAYDLRPLARGDANVLVGMVRKEPRVRLTADERMDLIFEELSSDLKGQV